VKEAKGIQATFVCIKCDPITSNKPLTSGSADPEAVNMEEILRKLDKLNTIETGQKQLNDKLYSIIKKIETVETRLKAVDKKLLEHVDLFKEVKEAQRRTEDNILDLQVHLRKNNIEIAGIPEKVEETREDLFGYLDKIGKATGVPIRREDIDALHRVPTRRTNSPKPIIVKFVRRWVRQDLLEKKTEVDNQEYWHSGTRSRHLHR